MRWFLISVVALMHTQTGLLFAEMDDHGPRPFAAPRDAPKNLGTFFRPSLERAISSPTPLLPVKKMPEVDADRGIFYEPPVNNISKDVRDGEVSLTFNIDHASVCSNDKVTAYLDTKIRPNGSKLHEIHIQNTKLNSPKKERCMSSLHALPYSISLPVSKADEVKIVNPDH